MSKLVDKERLAKLAKALDDRAKAAVKAEETRALAAEQAIEGKADANATAIAAINNAKNGLLAQAKAHVAEREGVLQNAINAKVDESVYSAKVTELVAKDNEQAGLINGLDAAVKAIEGKMGDGNLNLPAIDKAITNFKAEQKEVDAAQNQDIVKAQEAADAAQADVDAIEGRLDNEGGLVDRIEAVEEFVAGQPAKDEALQGEIDAVEGRMDVVEEFVEEHSHEEIEGRLDALEELHKENGAVDQKVAAVQQAVEGLQSEVTNFKTAQATKDQEQDDAIAAKVAQADYNAKVEALEGADTRLNQAIVDEAARAAAAEKANADAILAINNADTGILAQAKAHAQGLVDGEKGLREQADTALDNRLTAIENSVGEGGALEGRVAANEAKLAGLEEGCDTVQAAIDKAEADAKAHAEQKIADLVDSAPDAMNTLNELAKAINDNQDIYDGYVAEHATAMATMKSDLQKEIDDDIAAAKTLISAEIDADVKAEADRAKAEEADIRADFAAADTTLGNRISTLEGLVVGGEGEGLEAVIADVAQNKADIKDLKDADVELQTAIDEKVAQADYDTKVEALEGADVTLGNRIAVFEAGGGQDVAAKEVRLAAAEGEIDALQAFMNGHSHEAMEADIAANAKAIEDEVKEGGARDIAIAAALEDYSTTEEMKAILGNVVSSLALTMENDKVVLRLGGKEGIAVTEVSLDMATDADIDAIMAGLDAE